jgi:hypothetical protein
MSYVNNIRMFVRVYDLGSMSAAARDQRCSPAVASARISELEKHLGVRLFNRTTRSLQPTENGRIFYDGARRVLEAIDEAEAAVAECEARVGPVAISGEPPLPPVPSETHDFTKYVVLFLGIWLTYLIVDDAWLTLPTTLLTDRGLSVTASIAALSLTGFGFVAGALLAVKFGERVERKFLIVGALLVWSVILIIIGFSSAIWVITVFGFFASAVVGFTGPLLYAYTGEHFDSRHRGRGISIANGIGHTGGALAPYIVLPAAAVSFALAFAVMAAIALIAAVLVMFGRRMNGRSIA